MDSSAWLILGAVAFLAMGAAYGVVRSALGVSEPPDFPGQPPSGPVI